jgi:hypothetical protein
VPRASINGQRSKSTEQACPSDNRQPTTGNWQLATTLIESDVQRFFLEAKSIKQPFPTDN